MVDNTKPRHFNSAYVGVTIRLGASFRATVLLSCFLGIGICVAEEGGGAIEALPGKGHEVAKISKLDGQQYLGPNLITHERVTDTAPLPELIVLDEDGETNRISLHLKSVRTLDSGRFVVVSHAINRPPKIEYYDATGDIEKTVALRSHKESIAAIFDEDVLITPRNDHGIYRPYKVTRLDKNGKYVQIIASKDRVLKRIMRCGNRSFIVQSESHSEKMVFVGIYDIDGKRLWEKGYPAQSVLGIFALPDANRALIWRAPATPTPGQIAAPKDDGDNVDFVDGSTGDAVAWRQSQIRRVAMKNSAGMVLLGQARQVACHHSNGKDNWTKVLRGRVIDVAILGVPDKEQVAICLYVADSDKGLKVQLYDMAQGRERGRYDLLADDEFDDLPIIRGVKMLDGNTFEVVCDDAKFQMTLMKDTDQ